jgi:hypothetical protein
MRRTVKPPQYISDEAASNEARLRGEWIRRAQRFNSTNEAEDWSFLRFFFPPNQNILVKTGLDESAD